MYSAKTSGFDISSRTQKLEEKITIDCGERLPIEIYLVAELPPGIGNVIVRNGLQRQQKHENFVEEYNVLSARIINVDLSRDNLTAIYTFGIEKDLVFHRHTGQRAITAISGSSGVLLKFSSATPEEVEQNPQLFLEKMSFVEIPPDVIFILRFYGGTWHQFCSHGGQEGLFAVTVHVDEMEGLEEDEFLRNEVLSGNSSIPLLTECIPLNIEELLKVENII